MFTFIKSRWQKLDPAWRFSIVVYLVARVALTAWAFLVATLFPLVVANVTLHGEPVVTAFDLDTSRAAVFSRLVNGKELHFRASLPNLADFETGTIWDLSGRAVSGALNGSSLGASAYSEEEVFPYQGVARSQNIVISVWQRFDANWYLKIAQSGYSNDESVVYFPLYPSLIRLLSTFFLRRDLLAAIVISNLALIGVFYLIYQISKDLVGKECTRRAIVFFAFFPTAFFLFAPYTESLFMLFALASLREGIRGRWNRAGVFGALTALTRLQGVLMIVPLAYLAWKDFRNRKASKRAKSAIAKIAFVFSRFAALLVIPLSTVVFLSFTNLALLNAYESQLHARFVFPWQNFIVAITLIASAHASLIDISNLFVTLLFGAMIVLVWFKLPREFGLYSLAMYLAPLFRMTTEQPLVSMTRYALAIFPVFIMWGKWGENAWISRLIVYLSLPLQLYLSAQFVMWGWVG